MALPVLIGSAIVEGLAWGAGLDIYTNYVAPYLDDATEDMSLADQGNGGTGITDYELFEDIVKTNKALLKYHEVREDIYTPLNIDST